MNRKEDYRDMEKYHKACQRQHRRYYSKTSFLYPLVLCQDLVQVKMRNFSPF